MILTSILLAALITDCAELNARLKARTGGDTFAVTGTVTYVGGGSLPAPFFIEDGTNALSIFCFMRSQMPTVGDRVVARGSTLRYCPDISHANLESIVKLSEGAAPAPHEMTVEDICAGRGDNRVVALSGTVYAAFRDELDSHYFWLAVGDAGKTAFATLLYDSLPPRERSPRCGDKIRFTGICRHIGRKTRQLISRTIFIPRAEDVQILERPIADDFDSPLLSDFQDADPQTLLTLSRRKVSGMVVATWQERHALLKTTAGLFHSISLAPDQPQPACGQQIEAVGLTETDLYHINLSDACWRKLSEDIASPVSADTVEVKDLLTDPHGAPGINYLFHGRTVRVRGTVTVRQDSSEGRDLVSLESDGRILTVDASSAAGALDRLIAGSRAEVSGVVVVQTENWRPNRAFPRTTGVRLVLRSADDVRILARPPWWTPLRLMLVIGALVLALFGLSVWNRILNRLVERRSRQVAKEEISRDLARLKTEERTRLAVELHDTIAQNLTGVALQLDAVELAATHDPAALPSRLTLTKQRLQNSRDELRNVLWDLRSRAFEERELAVAIRRTIAPHLGTTQVDIDCDIPCRRLSDNAIHQILSIVRELVVNAIRHGQAKTVGISARLEGDRIFLTVTDDGRGFDEQARPGPETGHFGLQGLSERVHLLEGSFEISSAPGKGTVARLSQLRTDI